VLQWNFTVLLGVDFCMDTTRMDSMYDTCCHHFTVNKLLSYIHTYIHTYIQFITRSMVEHVA